MGKESDILLDVKHTLVGKAILLHSILAHFASRYSTETLGRTKNEFSSLTEKITHFQRNSISNKGESLLSDGDWSLFHKIPETFKEGIPTFWRTRTKCPKLLNIRGRKGSGVQFCVC